MLIKKIAKRLASTCRLKLPNEDLPKLRNNLKSKENKSCWEDFSKKKDKWKWHTYRKFHSLINTGMIKCINTKSKPKEWKENQLIDIKKN